MNSLFVSRKGEHLLSIWWFGVLMMVGGGIIFGTLIFYSDYVDARFVESESIIDKVERCLDNEISNDFFEGNVDVLNICNFNKESFSKGSDFFLKISEGGNVIYSFGNTAFDVQCEIKRRVVQARNFPECSNREIIVLDGEGKEHTLEIVAGSSNKGEAISNV